MKPSRISQPANAKPLRAGAPRLWSAIVLLLCELGLQAAQSPHGILADDPGESSNLATEHPEIVSALMRNTMKAREELGDVDRVGTGTRFLDAGERVV